jgi:hypothetical protein
MKPSILTLILSTTLTLPSTLQATPQNPLLPYPYLSDNAHAFMTTEDVIQDAVSGIRIATDTVTPLPVTGLYVQALDSTTCGSNSPSTVYDAESEGIGMVWATVTLPGKSLSGTIPISIGANFLYNMVAHAITIARLNTGLGNPGEAVTPGVGGTASWCLYLGITNLSATNMGIGRTVTQLPGNMADYNLAPKDPSKPVFANIQCVDSTATCTGDAEIVIPAPTTL